jgi:hypothetical protein
VLCDMIRDVAAAMEPRRRLEFALGGHHLK